MCFLEAIQAREVLVDYSEMTQESGHVAAMGRLEATQVWKQRLHRSGRNFEARAPLNFSHPHPPARAPLTGGGR
ncbi:hypothetical protein Acr_03g0018680 [Actinidia rufa]|uniref:Uncharacterized protein n=1 Tax=Actinidia rufa TaxID=165716 RepID=A0A7J0EF29_9ERIC|nr:hypothetical protein Acr_03g0018680 [Actinidia rufa]